MPQTVKVLYKIIGKYILNVWQRSTKKEFMGAPALCKTEDGFKMGRKWSLPFHPSLLHPGLKEAKWRYFGQIGMLMLHVTTLSDQSWGTIYYYREVLPSCCFLPTATQTIKIEAFIQRWRAWKQLKTTKILRHIQYKPADFSQILQFTCAHDDTN